MTGCNLHKNPLVKDETIAWLRSDIKNSQFLGDNTIVECGNYYAQYSSDEKSELKNKCSEWSKKEFKILQQDPYTSYQATIDNFRDPELWKIVIQKNGN